uniref:Retrovirus-related Pol polyprotein from transposon TNT 1-94 n=1 Tax=Cajanus cajan TaxID=3821 RepID=A0A151RF09_CAJCA|nr:Retrovirus-related Pol polyprotein from transposon TNT 1-94 [Cajanus cajan]
MASNVIGTCMNPDFHENSHTWIIDSGATSHICCSKQLYNSYTPIHNSDVSLPNSTKVNVEGIGSIKINDDIFLHNVLYIPMFRFNLLSLLTLINNNPFRFTMESNSFLLQDLKTLRTIGTTKQQQGLLVFEFPKRNFNSDCISNCNSVTYETWHKRLGHIPISVYKLIANKIKLSSIDSTYHCSTCNIAKQNRLPFPNPNKFSPSCFDLIHADIWGPFKQPTYDGFRYFLTLVDDKSRFTWIYMLQNKSDCIKNIPQIFAYVENQFQTKIKSFRSDNVRELHFKDFFLEKGVLHQFLCVERPKQNSVVERKHLHILNIARTLMFQSNVPIKIWGDYVKTVVFIMNRTPSPILNHISPYEILYNKVPNYSDFRTFGTLCYASTLLSGRHKFSPRAIAAVFIGYPHGYKGYKLFDLTTHQTFISKDVKFYEHIFPFQNSNSSDRGHGVFNDQITPNLNHPATFDDSDPIQPTHTQNQF